MNPPRRRRPVRERDEAWHKQDRLLQQFGMALRRRVGFKEAGAGTGESGRDYDWHIVIIPKVEIWVHATVRKIRVYLTDERGQPTSFMPVRLQIHEGNDDEEGRQVEEEWPVWDDIELDEFKFGDPDAIEQIKTIVGAVKKKLRGRK